jgi:hypothetical protein
MKFSERQGFRRTRKLAQINSMDADLRNRLWNALSPIWKMPRDSDLLTRNHDLLMFLPLLWNDYFKQPTDTIPRYCSEAIASIREYYFNCEWYTVYDFLEFIAKRYPSSFHVANLIQQSNHCLEEELSAYRFVDGKLIPITTSTEISAVETAIAETSLTFPNSKEHLRQAVDLLALKPKPDYRNSIKESISAVEALCAAVTGESSATLGQALKAIDPEVAVHGALRSAFEKLYGYTSDAEGIRHALMEEKHLEQEDAVFMLVACSAFVSYLIAKQARKTTKSV